MKKFKGLFLGVAVTLLCAMFLSCEFGLHQLFGRPEPVEERACTLKTLTGTDVPQVSGKYNFIVISDLHYGKTDSKRFEAGLEKWLSSVSSDLSQKPAFIICLGDIANSGSESEYQAYENFIKRIETNYSIKTYSAVGNHDLYNSGFEKYKKHVFPNTSFYKFETPRFSYYFTDTGSACFGKPQLSALEEAFKNDAKKKIICSHMPMNGQGDLYFRLQDITERNIAIALYVRNNVKYTLSGHTHKDLSGDFEAFYDKNYYSFGNSRKFLLVHADEDNGILTWEDKSCN